MTSDRGRYLGLIEERVRAVHTVLCLGIDPHPDELPRAFARDVTGAERFARLLLDAGVEHAAAVKPNVAFFEAFGSQGLAALERLRAAVPPGIPVILDAKRADIGSTAGRHAAALFDVLGADAVTANPYLGAEALEPLLARQDRFVYVLCRTSNPGAREFQDLAVTADSEVEAPAEPLYLRVARRAADWKRQFGAVGLVVGATRAVEMAVVLRVAPELPFLVPGVGVQGGEWEAALEHGPAVAGAAGDLPGGGLLVNVSRAIARAALDTPDPAAAVSEAARSWRERLGVLGWSDRQHSPEGSPDAL